MLFSELDIPPVQLLIGIGVGILIFSLALVFGKRSWKNVVKIPPQEEPTSVKEWVSHNNGRECRSSDQNSRDGNTMIQERTEKRRFFRRKGKYLVVEITTQDSEEIYRGIVLDRSINGLCLSVDAEFSPGNILNVRVMDLYPPMPWLEIKVAHSRSVGRRGWEIGCEFVTPPTWNIMLLFG